MEKLNKPEQPGRNDEELEFTISTTQGDWITSFDKNTKVQEVITAVVNHFGFAAGGNYQLVLNRKPVLPLAPERPLVSYGIKDGNTVEFTDLGVAV